ncbi:MAG: hypothetical protein AB1416_13215, partial [Actinomycetota bacterium]
MTRRRSPSAAHVTPRRAVLATVAALAAAAPAHAAVSATIASGALTVSGDGDTITVTCSGGNVKVSGADPAGGPAACTSVTSITVAGGAGADSIFLGGVVPVLFTGNPTVTADGGGGSDLISGGELPETLRGGLGNDVVTAGGGNDVVQWVPGDASDLVEGGAGLDRLAFTGSAGAEIVTVTANGMRTRVQRNVGGITMDLGGVETVEVDALAGADQVTVTGLAGVADLATVDVDGGDGDDALSVQAWPGATLVAGGNGVQTAGDALTVSGTAAADAVTVGAGSITAGGAITPTGVESLRVAGGGGADTIALTGAVVPTTLDGEGDGDAYPVTFGAVGTFGRIEDSGAAGTDAVTVAACDGVSVSGTQVSRGAEAVAL